MSVKVDLDQLAAALADFTFAYLITVGDDYRAHAVAVDPMLTAGVVDVGSIGERTRKNLAQHPEVTLVWPPSEPGGYSLIVDGVSRHTNGTLSVVPSRAVLHRKGLPGAATKPGCREDCMPLER